MKFIQIKKLNGDMIAIRTEDIFVIRERDGDLVEIETTHSKISTRTTWLNVMHALAEAIEV